jgi:hypothetical protein
MAAFAVTGLSDSIGSESDTFAPQFLQIQVLLFLWAFLAWPEAEAQNPRNPEAEL